MLWSTNLCVNASARQPSGDIRHRESAEWLRYNSNMTLQEFFLKQKEAHRKRTQEIFALLQPSHMPWKPESGALSIGEMLRHLWVSEEGVRRVALDGNFAYYEKRIPQGLGAVLGAIGSLEEELRNIERVHCETLKAVATCPAEIFDQERIHAGLGFRRKVSVILFGINDHEVHHRAQLMTYLRILGTSAPEPFQRPGK